MIDLFITVLMLIALTLSWAVAIIVILLSAIIIGIGARTGLNDKGLSAVGNLIRKFIIALIIISVLPSYNDLVKIKKNVVEQVFKQYHIKEK